MRRVGLGIGCLGTSEHRQFCRFVMDSYMECHEIHVNSGSRLDVGANMSRPQPQTTEDETVNSRVGWVAYTCGGHHCCAFRKWGWWREADRLPRAHQCWSLNETTTPPIHLEKQGCLALNDLWQCPENQLVKAASGLK